jgi:hypothetical protein
LVRVNSDNKTKNFTRSFTFELSDQVKTRFTIPVRMAEPMEKLMELEKIGSH